MGSVIVILNMKKLFVSALEISPSQINIDDVYNDDTTVGDWIGYVPRLHTGDAVGMSSSSGAIISNGTYVYIVTDGNNVFVFDTAKDISLGLYLGVGVFNFKISLHFLYKRVIVSV